MKRQVKSIWETLANSSLFIVICYLVGCTLIGYTTLAPRPLTVPEHADLGNRPHLKNVFFVSLSRPGFIIGLILWMLPTFLGKANMFRNFWSASFWVPLSKLTYLCYLITPVINSVLMSSENASLYLSYLAVYGLVWYSFFSCMMVSFLLHIFLEAPMMNLILSK